MRYSEQRLHIKIGNHFAFGSMISCDYSKYLNIFFEFITSFALDFSQLIFNIFDYNNLKRKFCIVCSLKKKFWLQFNLQNVVLFPIKK